MKLSVVCVKDRHLLSTRASQRWLDASRGPLSFLFAPASLPCMLAMRLKFLLSQPHLSSKSAPIHTGMLQLLYPKSQ
jgi:hypothetical protein